MKKALSLLLPIALLLSSVSCAEKAKTDDKTETTTAAQTTTINDGQLKYEKYASMTPEEIVAQLTLEQKASQMVQPAIYTVEMDPETIMKENDYGSILGEDTGSERSYDEWQDITNELQEGAVRSEAGIPFVYGSDHSHGVGYCLDSVIFPHNIGVGAANDPELTYQMGMAVADEARICHIPWNFFPVVTQSGDPRWGRTYECYSSDLDIISELGSAYIKGYIAGGGISCAKHFFAEGSVEYGKGEEGFLIDRGEATLTDAEIDKLLKVYQDMIDAGTQTIMISHCMLNGVKMHENKKYIMKLKEEMGFEGFIVSDWESIHHIPNKTFEEQVVAAINAGIDMLMEPEKYDEARDIIIDAVKNGTITEERVDDAVRRIIKVKKENGIFDDPFFEKSETKQKEVGSQEYRNIAEKMVEESLVLIKNENNVLPLKEGASVYIIGPASDDASVQCGGWTLDWAESFTKKIPGVTTVLEAFKTYADDYGIKVITNPDEAVNADVVLNVVGEQVYSEWNGDTEDLKLCGELGLEKNRKSMKEAKDLGKPIVTCIIAGRQVLIDEGDYNNWDSVVMCYLPGSEGKGISDVLCGCADFTGKLPSPWYKSVKQIGTDECWLEKGYGLNYGEGFVPRKEPVPVGGASVFEEEPETDPTEGTNYTKGTLKNGVYTNEYAKINASIPEGFEPIPEGQMQTVKNSILYQCSEGKDEIRETARAWDSYYYSDTDSMAFSFLNTKLGAPDETDYTEEKYLDDFKAFLENLAGSDSVELTFEERAKVKLGEEEYLREVVRVEYNGEKQYEYFYVRKLDDDLMCIVEMNGTGTDNTPEYYEKMFK
ncbi:MAG: glycoside hydrolase family 3 protein [Ruminococcus sp.]|uniref:glycoside hydrolase family 3 protein n=1 Tax=Ruminococcus sp. TaxID=41978 RepID=UPI0025FF0014|nr:glycoside hydrolase family 3 protein [Ruminococcus sp.]MBR5683335.1 glycoside hydrolase family 3 protein [Ruminococcus sp.]